MTDAQSHAATLRTFLLAGRNPDGGWGYYPGKTSRLEPTCWGLLALRDVDGAILEGWPAAGGLLRERQGGDVNFAFHALGLVVLSALGLEHSAGNAKLAAALENAKGVPFAQSTINRQNNALQGWSWIPGTFSWVEPTAWSMIALRQRASRGLPVQAARLTEAEALLVDRCCQGGGWNYGNSNMLGKELRPYVPTTAVALLALQKTSYPAVAASLAFLERAADSEPSAIALSLAILALAAYGQPADVPRALLTEQSARTLDLGHQLGVAMALNALQTGTGNGAFLL